MRRWIEYLGGLVMFIVAVYLCFWVFGPWITKTVGGFFSSTWADLWHMPGWVFSGKYSLPFLAIGHPIAMLFYIALVSWAGYALWQALGGITGIWSGVSGALTRALTAGVVLSTIAGFVTFVNVASRNGKDFHLWLSGASGVDLLSPDALMLVYFACVLVFGALAGKFTEIHWDGIRGVAWIMVGVNVLDILLWASTGNAKHGIAMEILSHAQFTTLLAAHLLAGDRAFLVQAGGNWKVFDAFLVISLFLFVLSGTTKDAAVCRSRRKWGWAFLFGFLIPNLLMPTVEGMVPGAAEMLPHPTPVVAFAEPWQVFPDNGVLIVPRDGTIRFQWNVYWKLQRQHTESGMTELQLTDKNASVATVEIPPTQSGIEVPVVAGDRIEIATYDRRLGGSPTLPFVIAKEGRPDMNNMKGYDRIDEGIDFGAFIYRYKPN